MSDIDLLERRVRQTLHERAAGVEATPALYDRVRRRRRRSDWLLPEGWTVMPVGTPVPPSESLDEESRAAALGRGRVPTPGSGRGTGRRRGGAEPRRGRRGPTGTRAADSRTRGTGDHS